MLFCASYVDYMAFNLAQDIVKKFTVFMLKKFVIGQRFGGTAHSTVVY
jgi:hypothetical protein